MTKKGSENLRMGSRKRDEGRKAHLQKSECGEGSGKRASRHKEQRRFKILWLSDMQEGTGDIRG